ncbi:MAG: LysR family transcriptional regulator [Peptostreptococcus sp.]|uniref:LysR family transcriptional regulator n=1 Tax=Peptostreptococcus sp. TaxID=1262 RepID=UPI002FC6FB82
MDTNIQKYIVFLKVVEYKSFSQAAKELNYSQSGVSRMIKDIENEFGFSLLERGKFGIKLTSEGSLVFDDIKEICQKFANLEKKIDEINGIETGMIKIASFSSVATYWLPKIIKEFKKDFPNIEYEIILGDYTEIENLVLKGDVDFAFTRLPTSSNLDTLFLEKDELKVVMPKDHPLASVEKFPINALEEDPFMLLEKNSETEISNIFKKYHLHPNIVFTTWDDYSIMAMVENNLGISILPNLILQRVPYKIISKPLEVPAFRNICLAFKDHSTLSLAAKNFIKYLDCRY